jgi:hypothetical protein
MGNTNGRTNPAPRKLEVGMAVVVWIKPGTHLFDFELAAGAKVGVWFKAELLGWWMEDNRYKRPICYRISYNDVTSAISNVIIIRSTAIADNLQPSEVKLRMKRAADRQHTRLVSEQ